MTKVKLRCIMESPGLKSSYQKKGLFHCEKEKLKRKNKFVKRKKEMNSLENKLQPSASNQNS